MTTRRDARLNLRLDAICALAATLPSETRQLAGTTLGQRVADLRFDDESSDAAVASDLARILGTLGCLPAAAVRRQDA